MTGRRGLSVRIGALVAVISVIAAATAAGAAPAPTWNEVTSPHVSGNSSEIDAMVTTGTDDLWAFGFDRANIAGTFEWRVLGEHWNGSTWTRLNTLDRETTPAHDFIDGAAATGPNDVWIVGHSDTAPGNQASRNLVEHWDGAHWTIDNTVPDPGVRRELLAASASGPGDIWAVGDATNPEVSDYNAMVLHRSGGTWSQVPFDLTVPGCNAASRGELEAVDAVGPTDVYVAGWCQSQPIGRERGFVAHWDGGSWTLVLRANGAAELKELATYHGEVWVAGNTYFRGEQDATFPLVFHGTAAAGFTQVPVRHSPHFGGPVGALSVGPGGVFLAGQLTATPHGNPTASFALHLLPNGKWRKELVGTNSGGYARLHAAATEPDGTSWLGGLGVGGTNLDPVALLDRRS